jgi:hypothetical protein
MKNLSLKIFALLLLLSLAAGCSVIGRFKRPSNSKQPSKTVNSTDGRSALNVPGNWRTLTSLHETAKLQAGDVAADRYAIVISERRLAFDQEMTLDEYTDSVLRASQESVPGLDTAALRTTEVNGYAARQFEAAGTIDKTKIKWFFTTVEGPKNFHQIVMWSKADNFEGNKKTFLEIIDSFRETDGKAALAPSEVPSAED